jgi:hypothetical protein
VSLEPYPDLPAAGTGGHSDDPVELDEADSRLLDALSRPAPPVVAAVEEQPVARPAGTSGPPPRGQQAPVFQEPPD